MVTFKRIVLLLLIVSLAACSSDKPEKTVDKFFSTVNKNLYNADKLLDASVFDEIDSTEAELFSEYFKEMSHKSPKLISREGDAAQVSVEVTAVDLFAVVQDFMQNVVAKALQDNSSVEALDDAELDRLLLAAISSPEAPEKTMTLTLDLVKKDGKWLIVANDVLRAGLFMQDPEMEPEEYGYGKDEDEYALASEESAEAKLLETQLDAGICTFQIDGDEVHYMYCSDEQIAALEGKEDEVMTITYQVFSHGEGSEDIYLVTNIE